MRVLTHVLLLGALSAAALHGASDDSKLTADFQREVTYLASPQLEGRGLGTHGLDLARTHLAAAMKSAKLKPAFGKSYEQPFDVKIGVQRVDGNVLDGVAESDWTPLAFSSSGEFSGELAFAGYGIDAAPLGYSDLSGVDLKGKVALILRYEPQEKDENSKFDGRRPSRWSALRYKVLQARERGATAVIFVTGPLQDEGGDRVPVLTNDGPESDAGIPVLQVKTSVAQRWLSGANIDLKSWQEEVDRTLQPKSLASTGVKIHGRVALKAENAKAANVAGMIPGKGALARETVVIGAHYDHLGYGGHGSMRPNEHAIHPGADDNASGSAAVLLAASELRRELAKVPNHRTVIFALFSGEEVGLAGSSYFVQHPPVPLSSVVGMINLDMVGRLRDDKLAVMGADSATEWAPAIQAAAKANALNVTASGDGYGPSDQTSFYAHQIPVLHLFTGVHDAYHTPDDTADKINAPGAARIIRFTAELGEHLAAGDLSPKYVRAQTAPAMEGDSRGYGAYLGTVPDYTAMTGSDDGVLLSDVRAGSPAALAGIKGGDRLIGLAGTTIHNLYDMTFALQDHKPGETVDVVLLRGGEKKTLRATLGSRGAAPKSPDAAHGAAAGGFAAGKPYEKTVEGEKHLRDIRQLTFGGENAEAYWSPDGKKLIFQATNRGAACDQEYVFDLVSGEVKEVSDGTGRTTCGYFSYPDGSRIVYASTKGGGKDCPAPPDRSHGYVWAIYDTYDIYEAKPDGSDTKPLIVSPGYDAEATWCHRGGKMIFTSTRDGDLDLYERTDDGKIRRMTNTPGYDGGAFYNSTCTEIVWRASRPQGEKLDEYRTLLKQGLVRPTALELFVMNSDGTNARAITHNNAANFCPYFHPDGQRVIFSSNVGSANGREFDLWMVRKDGTGEPERVTFADGFDGFPMFSPDGQYLVWASNRADTQSHETNLFLAKWVE